MSPKRSILLTLPLLFCGASAPAVATSKILFKGNLSAITTVTSAHTSIQVFDDMGIAHSISFLFHRVGAYEWDVEAKLRSGWPDIVVQPWVKGLRFATDGSFLGVFGPSSEIIVSWYGGGFGAVKSIELLFGNPGSSGAITQFGDRTNIKAARQDGHDFIP